MTRTGFLRHFVGCVAIALALATCASNARAQGAQGADDDWVEVDHTTTTRQTLQDRAAATAASRDKQLASAQPLSGAPAGTFMACGEPARTAQEPHKSIIAALNQMWGTHARVYESVTPMSPHASTGGCIFYNSEFQEMLTSRWMGITDEDQMRPMLYAAESTRMNFFCRHQPLPADRRQLPDRQLAISRHRIDPRPHRTSHPAPTPAAESAARAIDSRAFRTATAYAANSCPSRIGTASCICVRPAFTTPSNSSRLLPQTPPPANPTPDTAFPAPAASPAASP